LLTNSYVNKIGEANGLLAVYGL